MDGINSQLDYREITAIYKQASTIPNAVMTETFFTSPKESGDEVAMYTVGTSNQPANANTRGSMPRVIQAPTLSKSGSALFHSFNTMPIPFDKLQFLDSNNPDIQRVGRSYIESAVEVTGKRQGLFREAVIGSIMNYGRVNLGSDGAVLLPTVHATTGALTDNASATVSADFGLPNNHRGRCLITGSTYVFSGAWDTTSTDIISELDTLRDFALKSGCEMPNTIYLNGLRKQKLINNDKFKAWAAYNNMTNDAVLSRNEFANVWGWNFKFVSGYWTDSSGTQQPIIPVRQAVIVPDGADWKQCYEGTQRVPTEAAAIVNNFDEAMSKTKKVQGMFAFGQLKVSPLIQLDLITGDNFGMGFPNTAGSFWAPTVFAA